MTSLNTTHTFALIEGPPRALLFFRRVDIHELAQVACLVLTDRTISGQEIGHRLCEALDRELITRAED
jgi:hypothetical protein